MSVKFFRAELSDHAYYCTNGACPRRPQVGDSVVVMLEVDAEHKPVHWGGHIICLECAIREGPAGLEEYAADEDLVKIKEFGPLDWCDDFEKLP